MTNKNNKNNKGAKYRRDKRDAAVKREHELMEQEELESKVLKLTEFVTANDLANMMDVSVTEVRSISAWMRRRSISWLRSSVIRLNM